MKVDMVMPQMGESITEATVLKWLKNVGDAVKKDETILEISTDKVDSEIPSPESGILVEFKASEGDTVAVKSVIAIIETDAANAQPVQPTESSSASSDPAPAAEPEPAASPASPAPAMGNQNGRVANKPKSNPAFASSSTPAPSQTPAPALDNTDRYYSPLVRSLAQQHGLSAEELGSIPGTGTGGRVSKKDFMSFLESRGSKKAEESARSSTQSSAPAPAQSSPASAPAAAASKGDLVTMELQLSQ